MKKRPEKKAYSKDFWYAVGQKSESDLQDTPSQRCETAGMDVEDWCYRKKMDMTQFKPPTNVELVEERDVDEQGWDDDDNDNELDELRASFDVR